MRHLLCAFVGIGRCGFRLRPTTTAGKEKTKKKEKEKTVHHEPPLAASGCEVGQHHRVAWMLVGLRPAKRGERERGEKGEGVPFASRIEHLLGVPISFPIFPAIPAEGGEKKGGGKKERKRGGEAGSSGSPAQVRLKRRRARPSPLRFGALMEGERGKRGGAVASSPAYQPWGQRPARNSLDGAASERGGGERGGGEEGGVVALTCASSAFPGKDKSFPAFRSRKKRKKGGKAGPLGSKISVWSSTFSRSRKKNCRVRRSAVQDGEVRRNDSLISRKKEKGEGRSLVLSRLGDGLISSTSDEEKERRGGENIASNLYPRTMSGLVGGGTSPPSSLLDKRERKKKGEEKLAVPGRRPRLLVVAKGPTGLLRGGDGVHAAPRKRRRKKRKKGGGGKGRGYAHQP